VLKADLAVLVRVHRAVGRAHHRVLHHAEVPAKREL
jgi:hypothetical protein